MDLQTPGLTDDIAVEIAESSLGQKSLWRFVRASWPFIHAQPFVDAWYIGAICEHLQAVSRRQILRLVISIPPRHGKSTIACVDWPAWSWIGNPQEQFMFATYVDRLTMRDSGHTRQLIESPWYQKRWGDSFALTKTNEHELVNDKKGHRLATSTGASGLGLGGTILVGDDLMQPEEADSVEVRQKILDWYDQVWSQRLNDPKTGAMVVIGQRLHKNDVTGHVLDQGGYEHLMLPAEYDPKRSTVTCLGKYDKRHNEGELLNPMRYGVTQIADQKKTLGPLGTASQLQQNPKVGGGTIIQDTWWRFYFNPPPLEAFTVIISTWDFAQKDKEDGSYDVGQVWGVLGGKFYLLDSVRGHLKPDERMREAKHLNDKWHCRAIYVEDAAAGPHVVAALRDQIPNIVLKPPKGSKVSRVNAAAGLIEAGSCYLPDPKHYAWSQNFIDEFSDFPKGSNDDQCDAASLALMILNPQASAGRRDEDEAHRAALESGALDTHEEFRQKIAQLTQPRPQPSHPYGGHRR